MSQIFKTKYPIDKFIDFLNKITNSKDNSDYYYIDNSNYKLAVYKNILKDFFKELEEYYHISKQFYIKRKITYHNFITIIRQICKSHDIVILNKIIYEKSSYRLVYYIYI